MNKYFLTLILILLISSSSIFATAGGGTFFGNTNFNNQFSNVDGLDSIYYGGYGYGANDEGVRYGGYGLVILENDSEYYGSYGGIITGTEVVYGPLMLSINLWNGIGHRVSGVSYMCELNGEVGLALLPWMQLQLYGGIQGLTDFVKPIDNFTYYPVYGVRIVWGVFNS